MSDVKDAYRADVDAMAPAQRIERMLQLNQWAELGPLPAEELK